MNVAMDKEWSIDIFTKNLKMYMEPFGKNQKKITTIVGVSLPTFHDWLKGKKMPRMNNVQTKKSSTQKQKELPPFGRSSCCSCIIQKEQIMLVTITE